MSKLFFDHLLELDELEAYLRDVVETEEERHELWHIVDDIVHHEVMGCIFDHLPYDCHTEFLDKFHNNPHDEGLIIFITEKIDGDISVLINEKVKKASQDILQEINHL